MYYQDLSVTYVLTYLGKFKYIIILDSLQHIQLSLTLFQNLDSHEKKGKKKKESIWRLGYELFKIQICWPIKKLGTPVSTTFFSALASCTQASQSRAIKGIKFEAIEATEKLADGEKFLILPDKIILLPVILWPIFQKNNTKKNNKIYFFDFS